MQIEYDKKSNEVTIKLSINPKSTQLSSSKKTFIVGQDGGKLDIDGHSIRFNVLAYTAADGTKKGKK